MGPEAPRSGYSIRMKKDGAYLVEMPGAGGSAKKTGIAGLQHDGAAGQNGSKPAWPGARVWLKPDGTYEATNVLFHAPERRSTMVASIEQASLALTAKGWQEG